MKITQRVRNAKGCRKPPGAGRALGGSATLTTPWFQVSGLEKFCCSRPSLARAALAPSPGRTFASLRPWPPSPTLALSQLQVNLEEATFH